ncbi:unnamed protein product [Sphagnum troendelagicum]
MTPQRRDSGVLSSGGKETAAMGGRDLHATAAAQPPRRSIHNTTPHSSSNSSSRRSTQAFTELGPRRCGGIVDNIPAAAPAAPPPRRSTHKFIHYYLNTSLYGAWQKAYEGTDKVRIFIGCYREEEEALRAQDRACLKFKLPTEMLHYPEEDYVDDEELVSSSSPAATMIRSASDLGLATQVINPGCIFSQDL